jgi:hypothetical protein
VLIQQVQAVLVVVVQVVNGTLQQRVRQQEYQLVLLTQVVAVAVLPMVVQELL